MLIIRYLFMTSVFMALMNCSKDEDNSVVDDSIKLSSFSATFLAGDECVINVFSDTKDLAVYEDNSDIASAWWINKGKSVLIKGEDVGNTFIYIKDRFNPNRFAEIKVCSKYLEGNFRENGEGAIIIVQAYNSSIQYLIEDELRALARARSGTLYSFDKESKTVQIDYSMSDLVEDKLIGNYEWDKHFLTLRTNSSVKKYGFASIDYNHVIIELDVIETYKTKYPETPITNARISLILSRY